MGDSRRRPSDVERPAWAWPVDTVHRHQLWLPGTSLFFLFFKKGDVVLKCFITKLLLKNAQHVNSNWNDKR